MATMIIKLSWISVVALIEMFLMLLVLTIQFCVRTYCGLKWIVGIFYRAMAIEDDRNQLSDCKHIEGEYI